MLRTLIILSLLFHSFSSNGQNEIATAQANYADGNYIAALASAELSYSKDSTDLKCLNIIADASNKLGDQAKAKKYYHKLEKLDSSNVSIYVQLASIYEQQLRTPRAIKYYTILNKLLPDNPIYFRKNAKLYRSAGDIQEAFRLYAAANKLNPRDVLTIKGMAELCIGNNQMEMADSLIREGLQIDAENISMSYILAKSKYKQKQYDSVTLVLEGLRGQIDLNSYYNKLLGYSYLQIDSVDLAIQKLQLALVDDEESEKLHYYLATAFEKKNEMEGALVHFEKAVEFGKSHDLDIYHRNAARLANKEKQYKKAIAHYKDAYKYGNDPVVLYYLAAICDTYYKDKSIAVSYYQKYIKSKHPHKEYQDYAVKRRRYLKELMHQSN